MINLEAAQAELKQKNYRQIQEETAWKWASRAAACYQNCVDGHVDSLSCWTLGEEYLHEAIEHAALAEADQDLLKAVLAEVIPYQEKAAAYMSSGKKAPADEQNTGN